MVNLTCLLPLHHHDNIVSIEDTLVITINAELDNVTINRIEGLVCGFALCIMSLAGLFLPLAVQLQFQGARERGFPDDGGLF